MALHTDEEKLNKIIDGWQKLLFDTSRSNALINYRERSGLKLTGPSLDELFEKIAVKEKTLTFRRPIDRETDLRVYSLLTLFEHLDSPVTVTVGDIATGGSAAEQQRKLRNFRAKARLSIEEQGTNILYLAFGFIKWIDRKSDHGKENLSPLVLAPVKLTLDRPNAPYRISRYEDDVIVNPTLCHYLKSAYDVDLPEFDSDKESIGDYLTSIEALALKNGWRVLRETALGLFSFLKISMYYDLLANRDRIVSNPVIRVLAGVGDAQITIPPELLATDLDALPTRDCFHVLPADSTQQKAIFFSSHGVSFVMKGPPGTGKSQTIANMIAQAIAEGKKVLFVSEKAEALQVVYRRLEEVGLGDFCLSLHSRKANKREILNRICAVLDVKKRQVKDMALAQLDEFEMLRGELNDYVEALHDSYPAIGERVYDVFGRVEALHKYPSLPLEYRVRGVTPSDFQTLVQTVRNYEHAVLRL